MKKSRKKQKNAQPEPKRNIAPLDLEPPKRYNFNDEIASTFNNTAVEKPKIKMKSEEGRIKKKKAEKRRSKKFSYYRLYCSWGGCYRCGSFISGFL